MAGPEKDGEPAYLSYYPPLTHKVTKFPNATFPMTSNISFNKICPISAPRKPSTYHYVANRTNPQKTATQPSHHDETPRTIKNLPSIKKNQVQEGGKHVLCYLNTPALTTNTNLPSCMYPANPSDLSKPNDRTQGTTQSAIKPYRPPKMGTRLSNIKPETCKIILHPCNLAQLNSANPKAPQKKPSNRFPCIPIPTNDEPHSPKPTKNTPRIMPKPTIPNAITQNHQPTIMPVMPPPPLPITTQSTVRYQPPTGFPCHAPNITVHQSYSPTRAQTLAPATHPIDLQ